jgi:hypothetical protein
MRDNTRVGWGFEVQRFKINVRTPEVVPPGTIWRPDGQIWTPNSRLITGKNVVIDLAQEELLKIWRAIQGSVRQIEDIAVGDGLTVALDTDVALENELDSKNILSWDDSLISPDSSGLSEVKAQVVWLSLEAIGRLSEIGLKFDNGNLVTRALFKKLAVSGATQTNPVRITTSANHGLVTGDEVHLDNLGGMVELNDRDFTITVFDADEFDLDGEDGTGHTAYTSGGDVWLVLTKTTGEVVQTNYVLTMLS